MIHNPGLYFCECFLSVFIQPSLTMMIRVAKLLTRFREIFRLFPGEEKFIATLAHNIQNIPKLYIIWYKWHKSYSFKFDQVYYETHQSSIKCDRFQFQFQCSLNQGCWQKTEQVFGHCARFMCALMRPKSPQKWSANRVVSWESNQDRQFGRCGRSMCAAHRRVPWCVKKSSESDSTSAPSAPGRLLQCPASGLFKRSSKCSLYALSAFLVL